MKRPVYMPAAIGAAVLMLLRIFDQASPLSIGLVLIGITALVYSLRHADSKKEYSGLLGIIAITFEVRFYGYTGDSLSDILLGLLVGLIMFALLGCERLFRRFEDRFWYTLIFPAAYWAFMCFTEILKINMPFRMDPYFSCIPVLCQITAVFGIYSLDFLLAWTASVAVFVIDRGTAIVEKSSARKPITGKAIAPVAVYIVVLCGVIAFGFAHLSRMNALESAKTDTVRVAWAAGPYCGDFVEAGDVETGDPEVVMEKTLVSLTGIVEDAAEKDAGILMLSEEAYSVTDAEEAFFLETAEQLAQENDIHLLLAYEVEDTDGSEDGKGINKLCWISNEGEVLYEYIKHCLVPVVETSGYVRGDKNIQSFQIEVHGKTLNVATAICYDADFDFFMAHMGKNVDLLLLPTWDWKVIAEAHFSVARLRAIASQTTLVRCVYDGWDAVIDSAGHVLSRANTNDVGYETVSVYDVPVR